MSNHIIAEFIAARQALLRWRAARYVIEVDADEGNDKT